MTKETPQPTPPAATPRLRKLLWFPVGLLALLLVWSMFPPSWPGAASIPHATPGMKRSCKITRDRFDVPHINAASKEAAFYCWGKVHALDRGWQIDYLRRRAYGRVAEVYGMRYAKDDFQMRLLHFKPIADRWMQFYRSKAPKELALFRYYTWGINDGFAALKKKKPYIWKRLGYHPPPWRLRDSMMIIILQSFYQTRRAFTDDLAHARLRVKLGEIRYHQIYKGLRGWFPFAHSIIKPGEHPMAPTASKLTRAEKRLHRSLFPHAPLPTLRPTPPLRPSTRPATRKQQPPSSAPSTQPRQRPQLPPSGLPKPTPKRTMRPQQHKQLLALRALETWFAPFKGLGGGSNNWVVAPIRTQSGHAILANDPHLTIGTPSFWHETHIQAPGINAMGVGVPGVPLIASGNNQHVAWGITNGFNNSADLVRIRPDRRGVFRLGKKTYRVKSFRPVVWIKRGMIHFPVFWKSFGMTELGPILPIGTKPGEAILLRWTGYHIDKPPLNIGVDILKARDVKDLDAVFARWTLPCWNFVFADTKGGIGYRQVGLVAKRRSGIRGLLNGEDPKQQWEGFFTPQEMPHLLDPIRGFVATANNHPFPNSYPWFLGSAYIIGHRAKRIEDLIKATERHTPKTIKAIQTDVLVPFATLALQKMLSLMAETKTNAKERKALDILKTWDMRARQELVAPTIFRVWARTIEGLLFQHDIVRPNIPNPRTKKAKAANTKVFRPGDAAVLRALYGLMPIGVQKPIPTLLHEALRKTIAKLTRELGADINTWQWGRYHKIGFFHMLDRRLAYRPPAQSMHGGVETVDPALLKGNGPFWVRNAASYRLVIEMVPGRIRSWGVLAGKNIDKEPRKLGKQQKLWLQQQYRPRPFYPDEIKKYSKSTKVHKF